MKITTNFVYFSNCVAGVTGETAIADLWRDHYEELLNSTASSHEKEDILEHFKTISSHVGMQVTMLEVLQIAKDLPNAKFSGLDGLNGESLKYVHPLLCLLLSIGFTCMLKHCYILQCMINFVIIPLIKNKCGDHTGISFGSCMPAIFMSLCNFHDYERLYFQKSIIEYCFIEPYV